MKYAHYNSATGRLLGWYDDTIHETIPEPNVAVTDAIWQIAINNNYNYVDPETGSLSIKDFRTFEEKRQEKINELKASYQTAINADIAYMNTVFQADEESQNRITKVLIASGGILPGSFFWLDKLNNPINMTYSDLLALANGILLRNQRLFAKYQALRERALEATTEEELNAITWQ